VPQASAVDIRHELEALLDGVIRSTECHAIAIARTDGLVVAHRGASGLDPRIVAAVAATIVGAAEVVAQQLGQGEIEEVTIRCTQGRIIAVNAGREAVVIALYGKSENLGLAFLTLGRVAGEIGTLLDRA